MGRCGDEAAFERSWLGGVLEEILGSLLGANGAAAIVGKRLCISQYVVLSVVWAASCKASNSVSINMTYRISPEFTIQEYSIVLVSMGSHDDICRT